MSDGESGTIGDNADGDGAYGAPDPRDFAAVYDDEKDHLRAYAASLLRGGDLMSAVEDVVQDAVLALWKRHQETGTKPSNWVAAMMNKVRFCALDRMKSAPVRHAGFSLDEDESTFQVAQPGDFATDYADAALARAALARLEDSKQREVLYLLFYEDKTQAQIAAEMGLTPGRITQIKQAGLLGLANIIDQARRR